MKSKTLVALIIISIAILTLFVLGYLAIRTNTNELIKQGKFVDSPISKPQKLPKINPLLDKNCINYSCTSDDDCKLVGNPFVISECSGPVAVNKATTKECLDDFSRMAIQASCVVPNDYHAPEYKAVCIDHKCEGIVSTLELTNDAEKTLQTDPKTPSSDLIIPAPETKQCNVYTYQDKFIDAYGERDCLDNISLRGIYFVAKDQKDYLKSYWKDSMLIAFNETKKFFEEQFDNKISIKIEEPTIIYGDKNIEEYDFTKIYYEVKDKYGNNNISNYFIDYGIYVISGNDGNGKDYQGNLGGVPGAVVQGSFFLDPNSFGVVTTKYGTDYSGYMVFAHEFGHSLGIPHPWDEDVNKNSDGIILDQQFGNDEMGSLMSYGGRIGPLIPNSFIRNSVKQRMIVGY